MPQLTDVQWVFLLALLYNVGKSGAHATRIPARGREWVRKPLFGVALFDLYHAFSGIQWLLVLAVCWRAYGPPLLAPWPWTVSMPWVASLLAWGLVWPLSKALKGLTVRQALLEAWYVQLFTSAWRLLRWVLSRVF